MGVTLTHLQPSPTTAAFKITAGTNHTSLKTQVDQKILSSTSNGQISLTTTTFTTDSSVATEMDSLDSLKTSKGEGTHVHCNLSVCI